MLKFNEVDPLVCPRCFSEMRLIAMIEDPDLWKINRIRANMLAGAKPVEDSLLMLKIADFYLILSKIPS